MKIFGEEHFIDPAMIVVKTQNSFREEFDKLLVNDVYKATMEIGFAVDKDKLKNWLELCGKLEQIDKSDLIDMAISKKFAEKNQHIKELGKENKNKSELGLALYTSLAKELENQGMIDNIPSAIDQLVGKNCGKYADMYSEYKNQQKELALYKKALELSCEFLQDMNMKVYGTKSNWEEFYLDRAKEEIDENNKKA